MLPLKDWPWIEKRVKCLMNCFCGMADRRKALSLISSRVEVLTIANLRHASSRVWTCAEPEFRLCWGKFCSSDNHYTDKDLRSIGTIMIFGILILLMYFTCSFHVSHTISLGVIIHYLNFFKFRLDFICCGSWNSSELFQNSKKSSNFWNFDFSGNKLKCTHSQRRTSNARWFHNHTVSSSENCIRFLVS